MMLMTSSSSCSPRMILLLLLTSWIIAIRWDACCCSGYACWGISQRKRRLLHDNKRGALGHRTPSTSFTRLQATTSVYEDSTTTLSAEASTRNENKELFNDRSPKEQQQQLDVAFDRAKEVSWILVTEVVVPLVQSLLKMGRIPRTADDWEDFWSFPSNGKISNKANAHVDAMSSLSSAATTKKDGDDGDVRQAAIAAEVQSQQHRPEINNAQRICVALERLGPTFVKFGQALSTRPDIIPTTLANALLRLTDRMEPFDTAIAKSIIRNELLSLSSSSPSSSSVLSPLQIDNFIENLSTKPVAAASIGQVYFGFLDKSSATASHDATAATTSRTRMKVAVKVKRPGIRETVRRDAAFLKLGARWIDQLSSPFSSASSTSSSSNSGAVIATRLENAVDEFMTRIFEELDYQREATNVQTFARLYSHRRHEKTVTSTSKSAASSSSKVQVVVPELVPELCTQEILVMEWLNGTKFDAVPVLPDVLDTNAPLIAKERKRLEQRKREIAETIEQDLQLVQTGIQCTLSQLIETGILHADPHPGNLLKVIMPPKKRRHDRAATSTTAAAKNNDIMLGYLDFGLLATIPETVRDALICSVAQLVFARNIDAMARLFIDLQLLPPHRAILLNQDPVERAVFTRALNETLDNVLQFPDHSDSSSSSSVVPILRFDNLLGGLTSLVARFEFQLPPYFLNNARALATLEGVARRLDPTFNVLQIMYPFALNRLINNPSQSPIVDETLVSLLRSSETNAIEMYRIQKLLDDSALLTGYSRRRVLRDVFASKGGRRTIRKVLREMLLSRSTTRRREKMGRAFAAKHSIFRL